MVKDHDIGSTWYSWFDDNLDDFYTADPLATDKPLKPTQLVNSLLENQITLWNHHDFAPWLAALAEQAFYKWPTDIPFSQSLPTPQRVSSPKTKQLLFNAFRSLPSSLSNNINVQELVLMYLGASHSVVAQVAQTPKATALATANQQRHQERYAKRTEFYKQHGLTTQEYIEQHLKLNSTD
ncbi:hypothetical protein [Leptothoe spongobia]|uniref:Uncharacterized protein n=1 Tax=Leptothoe spongobia TAU-MAC 1115 TaxID=1967444 RepID=A0A947GKK3_9CYAN|nr:hypothetical protein [Leptothoe spongobia]MBT9317514.1 hypothetical protein [Leptothoe spongobia TAU-MAC 1115]